ncbi:MAG TPA: hypothetical protein VID68_13255 [Solirubrobacteraceae bacterium]
MHAAASSGTPAAGGVNVHYATAFGHHRDQLPINECAAWRLAFALGDPLNRIVAPCVMWSYAGEPGSLTRRLEGVSRVLDPFTAVPEQCRAAAFFDALIAQQDRHTGNMRWDAAARALGLFDHGYAFSLPGHRCNAARFVEWRWSQVAQALEDWEKAALQRLVIDPTLLGLDSILRPERAQALRVRAEHMLLAGELLPPASCSYAPPGRPCTFLTRPQPTVRAQFELPDQGEPLGCSP